jgi:hypothetical protein
MKPRSRAGLPYSPEHECETQRALGDAPARRHKRARCAWPAGSVRPLLGALTEDHRVASTEAVTTASTPTLPLQAWSSHVDPAHDGRRTREGAPLRTIAFASNPPDDLRPHRRRRTQGSAAVCVARRFVGLERVCARESPAGATRTRRDEGTVARSSRRRSVLRRGLPRPLRRCGPIETDQTQINAGLQEELTLLEVLRLGGNDEPSIGGWTATAPRPAGPRSFPVGVLSECSELPPFSTS